MAAGRGRTIHARRRQSKKSPVSKAVLLVIAAALVIGLGSWGIRSLIDANNQARLDRIEEISNRRRQKKTESSRIESNRVESSRIERTGTHIRLFLPLFSMLHKHS